MNLRHLRTNRYHISRMTTSSGSKIAMSTVTSAWGHFQTIGADKIQAFSGVYGKAHILWADPTEDILEGDLLVWDTTGDRFKVRHGGVTHKTFGNIDYKEIVIDKVDS